MNPKAYGSAKDLEFGTPESAKFVVIDDMDEDESFEDEYPVHNRLGVKTGWIWSNPSGNITIRGLAKKTDIDALPLGSILQDITPDLIKNGDIYIKGRRTNRTKGQLMTFELTAVAADGVTGPGQEIGAAPPPA